MTLSIRMRDLRVALALCSTLLLAACLQPYRMEIQQGNIFDQSTLDQVKVGMTKKQVRFLLGTPLVSDPFHANRWDYFYSLYSCLLYTSPSPRDGLLSRMPSSA